MLTASPSGDSPLQEIERAVQERAKGGSVDLRQLGGSRQFRVLIEDEVRRWTSDFKRGLRPFDLLDPEVVIERAHRNLVGYGPLQPLLDDDDVWEIMINAPDLLFPGQVIRLPPPPPAPA